MDEPERNNSTVGEGTPERRMRRRALISAPVRVRATDSEAGTPDEVSTTVDVSRNGFLFVSSCGDFSRGMTVAVTFPYSHSPAAIQAEQPGRIVRVSGLHDGRIAVAVAIGAGMRAEKSRSGHDRRANCVPRADAPSFPAAFEQRPLVLVVDSDAAVRTSLRDRLEDRGYEVLALHNSRQAHALLDQMLPALVIAEIDGRDLPGYEICARVKSTERLQRVPVVLTTRSAYPSDYANAHSLGAVVCLAKPFRMERIEHLVQWLAPTAALRGQDAAPLPITRERRSGIDRRKSPGPGRRSTRRK